VTRGEVWWLEHPADRRRPVCVVTRAEAVPALRRLLVVPATRTIRGIPTEVRLGTEDGMPEDCVLALDNVQVVPKALLVERITRLPASRLAELCVALRRATAC